jgi:ZIP family zinc transporter
MLSFAAGIMLAATMFSLLMPAYHTALAMTRSPVTAASGVVVALGLGGAALWLVHTYLPHEHFCATLSGLLEPVGGIVGAGAVAGSSLLLPWALAFAAGAMLFVLSSEVIPETHRPGLEGGATAAFFVGFAAMIFVDFSLD